jgi:hypothetical protein
MKNTLIFMVVLASLGMAGCTNPVNYAVTSKEKNNKVADTSKATDTTDIVEYINAKNIFSIPSERNTREIEFSESTSQVIVTAPPQYLSITGIARIGRQYLLSVENSETKERKFLLPGDAMGPYRVISITSDNVEAQKQNQKSVEIFNVGDQVELPGTSLQVSAPPMTDGILEKKENTEPVKKANGKRKNKGKSVIIPQAAENESPESTDFETLLRERRKKQEEELQ